jgi:septal ring factor EnvC (AmiA/AmiB activator)
MDANTKDILDALNFIKEHMLTKEEGATKSDIAELRFELRSELAEFRAEVGQELRDLRRDIAELNKRLDLIEQHYANLKGVTKEIDEIRAEVRAIEKHLGLNKKTAV